MASLVKETFDLHKCLKTLTFMPASALINHLETLRSPEAVQQGLMQLEQKLRDQIQLKCCPEACPYGTLASPDTDLEKNTLVGLTTKFITPSKQAEDIQKTISGALHKHGDSRVVEAISIWWNDELSRILVLEGQDDADDATSTHACALLYYLVSCYKLIYVFKMHLDTPATECFGEMLLSLVRNLISLHKDDTLQGLSFPPGLPDLSQVNMGPEKIKHLVTLFLELLEGLVGVSDKQVLIVIDGWEQIIDCSALTSPIQEFLSGIHSICKKNDYPGQAMLKILLGCKGHATIMYNCVGIDDVADLTDHATRTSALSQELALAVN